MPLHGYEATLQVENPLSFRTNEYGNVVRTSRILHNFALRFALNNLRGDPAKDHIENLRGMPVFATPAIPVNADFEFQTFHPFPEAPQLFRRPERYGPGSLKTLQGAYTVLHHKEFVRPGSTFLFAIASTVGLPDQLIITYGGKASLQRVALKPADVTEPADYEGLIDHPLNPLDFDGGIHLRPSIKHLVPPSPLFEGRLVKPLRCRLLKARPRQYLIPVQW